jgi:hypothetical protein
MLHGSSETLEEPKFGPTDKLIWHGRGSTQREISHT